MGPSTVTVLGPILFLIYLIYFLNRFTSAKHLNCKMSQKPWNIVTTMFPVSILTKQHSICGGKYLLKTPGNAISENINFKMSLDASALKNMYLWSEFQSHLVFIISLLLKSFLTAPIHWTLQLLQLSILFQCSANMKHVKFKGTL